MTTNFSNARLVLPHGVETGALSMTEGCFVALDRDSGAETEIDCDGDFLLPGLIDLHTDNLEHHFSPRPGVRWPATLTGTPG